MAEKQNIVEASNCLGKMYLFGKGVKKNLRNAFKHFTKSAEKKNEDGLYYLGYMIEHGLVNNIKKEERMEKAIEYYE